MLQASTVARSSCSMGRTSVLPHQARIKVDLICTATCTALKRKPPTTTHRMMMVTKRSAATTTISTSTNEGRRASREEHRLDEQGQKVGTQTKEVQNSG